MSGHYGSGPVPPGVTSPAPPRAARVPIPPERLASFGRRAGAAVIDGIVVTGIALAILAALGAGFFSGGDAGFWDVVVSLLLLVVLFAALALLYAPLVMVATNGKTPGKLACGCRVVRPGGEPITFAYAVLREALVKGLLGGAAGTVTGGLSYLVDYLWPLFDGQNRAVHDLLVDSRVIRD
jgi:uncharacterized RDD family membrane protein YckC